MRRQRYNGYRERRFIVTVSLILALAVLSYSLESVNRSVSLHARNLQPLEDEEAERCRLVHRSNDQCAFIKSNCPDEEVGLLSYLTLYYCRLNYAKPIGFTILALWLGILFSTIGVAASEFLSPNLSTLSKVLGMSESLTGVTFLAFGNGSPDVFSTFAAVKSHSGSLALGELIGAAGFITAFVAGIVAIIRPFQVSRRTFVRDIMFFIVAISFSMVFLANGNLALWECLVMVGFYIFYVITVCVWHWYFDRRRRRWQKEAAARAHYVLPESQGSDAHGEYHDDDDANASSRQTHFRNIAIEDFDALEQADHDTDEFNEDEARSKWMGELSRSMRASRRVHNERRAAHANIRPSLIGALEFRSLLSSLQNSRNIKAQPVGLRRYSEDRSFSLLHQSCAQSSFSVPEIVTSSSAIEARASRDEWPSLNTRVRAVSANDAEGLRLNSTTLRQIVIPDLNVSWNLPVIPGRQHVQSKDILCRNDALHSASSSPVRSVSPPASELANVDSFPALNMARANTQDFLAVPDASAPGMHRRSRSPSPYGPPESTTGFFVEPGRSEVRPRLRMSPPDSTRSSSNTSPKEYPNLSYYDDPYSSTSITRPPSLRLPSAGPPPGSFCPETTDFSEQTRHWKWWPYRTLPPPEILACTLVPVLYGWHSRNVWQKMIAIASAPSIFLLTITLPVVDLEDEAEDESETAQRRTSQAGNVDNPSHSDPAETSPIERRRQSVFSLAYHSPNGLGASDVEAHHFNTALHHSSLELFQDVPDPSPCNDDATPPAAKLWNRWLVILQCFTAPYFIVLVYWANFLYPASGLRGLLQPSLISLFASMITLALLLHFTTPTHPPDWHVALCFVGFAVSVTWIATIANEVVGILKTIGVILNWSDAILGLTIFSLGNSLGDLVADITVARLGFPVMALSACFGGPMLNILLGIGMSGFYMSITGAEERQHKHSGSPVRYRPYRIEVDTTLLISAVALLVTLLALLVAVPLNGWRMDKRIGVGLVGLWCVATVGNVAVEYSGIAEDVTAMFR